MVLYVIMQWLMALRFTPAPPVVVDELAVRNVVDSHRRAMRLCDQAAGGDHASARLDTRVTIEGSGSVSRVGFDGRGSELEDLGRCLTATIMTWRFPAAGGAYQVRFPIILIRN